MISFRRSYRGWLSHGRIVGERVYFEAAGVPGEFPGFGLLVVGLAGSEVSVEVAAQDDYGDPGCTGVV